MMATKTSGLVTLGQDDFSAGAFPDHARDAIPGHGLEDAINALINNDGHPFRRGGTVNKSGSDFGTGLRFLWDGYLPVGLRTLFADSADWGTLESDDTTTKNLGGAGISALYKPAVADGMLFIPGGFVWGGSRKTIGNTLNVSAETITANEDSATITTANPPTTAWTSAIIEPGTLWRLTSGGTGEPIYYPVQSLDNDHQVTLARPYRAGSFLDFVDFEFVQFGTLSKAVNIYIAVANRIIACSGTKAYMSGVNNPTYFADTEFHELPAGASILGGEGLRGTGYLFTTAGIFAISNLAFELTDAYGNTQQRLEHVNRDIILWSWPGVTQWGNALIVPAVDGVWLFDGVSSPQRITGGIEAKYRSYVDAGYQTGYGAVYNGTYFLPIMDASFAQVDVLTCRLQPTRRGTTFAWGRMDGDGAEVVGFANRSSTTADREPSLLAGHLSTGRVLTANYFSPATSATDADGSAHVTELITREFRVDAMIRTVVRRLEAVYEMVNAGGASTLTIDYSVDGGAWISVTAAGPESTLADKPASFAVNSSRGKGVRFRIRTSGSATKFVLHSLKAFLRQSGRR